MSNPQYYQPASLQFSACCDRQVNIRFVFEMLLRLCNSAIAELPFVQQRTSSRPRLIAGNGCLPAASLE